MKWYLGLALICTSCAPSDGCRSWEEGETVYVWVDDPEQQFSETQRNSIHRAVLEWETALDGFVTFELTEGKGNDNLIVIRPSYRAEIREADGFDAVTHFVPWERGGGIVMPIDVSDWEFHAVMLHEMGHALGLDHDSGRDTIMQPGLESGDVDYVTCRDIEQFCLHNDCEAEEFPPCLKSK